MTFDYPLVLGVAALVTAVAVAGYVAVQKRRAAALTAAGFAPARSRRASIRRHLPYALLLAAVPILITGLARPAAELELPDLGMIVVEDAETGEQLLLDSGDPLLRGRLAAEVQARESGLAETMNRAGVAAHRVTTDTDLVDALVDMVRRTRRRTR
jgi:hypothetical protein